MSPKFLQLFWVWFWWISNWIFCRFRRNCPILWGRKTGVLAGYSENLCLFIGNIWLLPYISENIWVEYVIMWPYKDYISMSGVHNGSGLGWQSWFIQPYRGHLGYYKVSSNGKCGFRKTITPKFWWNMSQMGEKGVCYLLMPGLSYQYGTVQRQHR